MHVEHHIQSKSCSSQPPLQLSVATASLAAQCSYSLPCSSVQLHYSVQCTEREVRSYRLQGEFLSSGVPYSHLSLGLMVPCKHITELQVAPEDGNQLLGEIRALALWAVHSQTVLIEENHIWTEVLIGTERSLSMVP